ncbi:MAG TPA: aminoacyl-tRNA hydrolase [Flavobacteriaceae bacterium]|nr:alternative ribosome rescue aminoacyl-tRNA hydrolase ArfB [Ulvibacter sp.]CAI8382739.1 MAG: Peptidyl-tRNA hydrolase ArfB [Flavobacteriaceae bacterium]HAH33457.1 aminoacyl-tRNA hydrolase [Flavobacteriaceae bacterium]|tara:strand:+ start:4215 stop:4619 length:405 start_codon:yes stop_codon:yes gene_type:complete
MDSEKLLKEISFKAVRSSGPGGQHVNKTASKAVISFTITSSQIFTPLEKQRLLEKLKSRISQDGILTITCSESRSQHRNKALAIARLFTLLEKSLRVAKSRKKSRPSKNAIEKRIVSKKKNALKKANRKPPSLQ